MGPGKQGLLESATASSLRAQELYKYFSPPKSSSRHSAPDTILAAHAQLVAWRMNTRRSMVSLIDRDTQYFVAEAAKTLNLVDRYQTLDRIA
jgi:hypothetical protein